MFDPTPLELQGIHDHGTAGRILKHVHRNKISNKNSGFLKRLSQTECVVIKSLLDHLEEQLAKVSRGGS